MLGDKLKSRAFCQFLYIEFEHSPKHSYMEKPKKKRKIVVPLPSVSPTPPTPYHRVTASGASLDNDTFTLTCHHWVVGVSLT
ncbi:MAG: hypothetical protein F6K31_15270 [Symploca sp. SIO2G7]|nr:hypothetical protein [Symploca sp. SIO2G7]